jgi:hypothetical protein
MFTWSKKKHNNLIRDGRVIEHACEGLEMRTQFWSENLKGRDVLGDIGPVVGLMNKVLGHRVPIIAGNLLTS